MIYAPSQTFTSEAEKQVASLAILGGVKAQLRLAGKDTQDFQKFLGQHRLMGHSSYDRWVLLHEDRMQGRDPLPSIRSHMPAGAARLETIPPSHKLDAESDVSHEGSSGLSSCLWRSGVCLPPPRGPESKVTFPRALRTHFLRRYFTLSRRRNQ